MPANKRTVSALKSLSFNKPRNLITKSSGVINFSPFFSMEAYLLKMSCNCTGLALFKRFHGVSIQFIDEDNYLMTDPVVSVKLNHMVWMTTMRQPGKSGS
ncbi:hypothetical protein HUJ05_000960 [Dendroctonus ponderosae]|nr:hypothetical protein HUJ05_000960 [Dendroctonus ponderosae]